ncbi:hypothetical protein BDV41DRAFT_589093 [Aspergillus transmontanensis]|uniref:NAD-dependent epimerase/dehydratase domain-containing protein n=1 Tax=Aspergillus transmontanensis TaxID=1034304 RepID=A0A5N6VTX9_9EURO|nr:hypothetical protein BDV41DRAFT_589093 [Aspergillus transmontanensis]
MSSIIFMTGATEFIGSHVAKICLEAGYSVRLSLHQSMPAVEGTLSLLKAAAKHPSIKKVVFTASVDSFVPLQQNWERMVIKETNDISLNNTPTTLGRVAQYHASKIASFQTVVRYAACHKPKFSIVTLHPVFVFGASLFQESAKDLSYDNRMLIKTLYSETPGLRCLSGVHVIDVAEAHLHSLHCSITGLSSFLLASKARPWRDVHSFVQSAYPYAGFRLLPH